MSKRRGTAAWQGGRGASLPDEQCSGRSSVGRLLRREPVGSKHLPAGLCFARQSMLEDDLCCQMPCGLHGWPCVCAMGALDAVVWYVMLAVMLVVLLVVLRSRRRGGWPCRSIYARPGRD